MASEDRAVSAASGDPRASAPSLIYAAVALGAAYLLLGGASFITFLADPQLASLTWLLLLILAVAGAVQVGWRGAGNTAILALLVVLLLLALASALRSVYPRGALEGVAWLLLQVGLFGLALGLAEPPAALWGVLTAAVPVAMLGLAEAAGWRRPAVEHWTEFGALRAMATFNHPNNFAGFVALVAPLSAGAALAAAQRGARVLALGGALLLLALLGCAATTYSRGGQLATLAGLALLVLLLPSGGLRAWWARNPGRAAGRAAFTLAGAVLLFWCYWRSPAGARLRHFTELLDTLPQFERWGTWVAAWDLLRHHPWLGVGPNLFGCQMAAYRQPGTQTELYTHAHNWFLQVAAEQGVPALLVFLALTALAVRQAVRRAATAGRDRALWLGLAAGLGGFALAGLLDYNVGVPSIGLAFWFLLGLAANGPRGAGGRWRGPLTAAVAALGLGLGGGWLVWNMGNQHYLASLRHLHRGDLPAAAVALAEARRLDPRQRAYPLVEADLYLWSGRPREAYRVLRRLALAGQATDSYSLDTLSWLAAQMGELPEAISWLGVARAGDQADPVLPTDAGLLALQAGDVAAAQEAFAAARRAGPNYVGATVGGAEVARRRGQPAQAAELLAAAAMAGDPRDRVPRFMIAYGRVDPRQMLPQSDRARLWSGRVRYHGTLLPRLRLRTMEARLRAAQSANGR